MLARWCQVPLGRICYRTHLLASMYLLALIVYVQVGLSMCEGGDLISNARPGHGPSFRLDDVGRSIDARLIYEFKYTRIKKFNKKKY